MAPLEGASDDEFTTKDHLHKVTSSLLGKRKPETNCWLHRFPLSRLSLGDGPLQRTSGCRPHWYRGD